MKIRKLRVSPALIAIAIAASLTTCHFNNQADQINVAPEIHGPDLQPYLIQEETEDTTRATDLLDQYINESTPESETELSDLLEDSQSTEIETQEEVGFSK